MNITGFDKHFIAFLRRSFLPVARFSIFLVYFWFGILKLLHLSPASPLAAALTNKTIGPSYFGLAFAILAIYECLIGLLFLFPKATRLVIPLLIIHLAIVCSPLILVPGLVWTRAFVPTLEGQYIIKNAVIVALAIGISAQTKPLKTS